MSRLSIVYIVSLIILGVLLVFTVFRPMASGERFTTVMRESVIQREDQWIIQVDIINREGKTTGYVVNWSSGGETYSQEVSVKDGRVFTSIHYVYPEAVEEGEVNLTIYREGEATPFEEATYYVSFEEE